MKLDAKIQAIELLLANEGLPPAHSRESVKSGPSTNSGQKTSLRLSVLRALEASPRVTAAEVARQLQDEGFRVGGATSLRTRIAHELSRLRRKGVLRKYRNGRYAIRSVRPDVPKPEVDETPAQVAG